MTTPLTDDTAQVPWAQTETMPGSTAAAVDAADPADPAAGSAGAGSPPATAPALNPPTWTGRKTAIAAALAIGISSMGAVAAAAALPAGTVQDGGQVPGGFGPGGRQLPGGGPGQQGGFGPQGGQPQQAPADPDASTT
jgi:hypothetical protein